MPEDLKEVILALGAYMIKLAGKGENIEENKQHMVENIKNGMAYQKLLEMVKNQGGDISYLEDTSKFERAKFIEPIVSTLNGYIQEIECKEVGKIECELGAGRIKKEDKIDYNVGIVLCKKVGDKVEDGEILAYIHANNEQKLENAKTELLKNIKIEDKVSKKEKTILQILE